MLPQSKRISERILSNGNFENVAYVCCDWEEFVFEVAEWGVDHICGVEFDDLSDVEKLKTIFDAFNDKKNKDDFFVIDPIDGTSNFIHGIPQFCIVISKLTKNNITDGIIYNPITNEFFWASKGKGAWLNNHRIRVSKRKNLNECIIGASSIEKQKNYIKQSLFLKEKSASFRAMGSAALDLAFVASGRLDAFWGNNLNIWDISAGVLLVSEAGGKITKTNGNEWDIESRDILASNSSIHDEIIII